MAKKSKNDVVFRWSASRDAGAEPDSCEALARDLVAQFGDLLPSVTRIMEADLDAEQRLMALTLFSESLTAIGDPNRDPRQAIDNARR